MAISIECDDCGAQFRVSDDKAGTRVRCKECGSAISIPDDDMEADFEDRPRSRSRSKKKRGGEGVPTGVIIGVGAVGALIIVGVVLVLVMRGGGNNPQVAGGNPDAAAPGMNPPVVPPQAGPAASPTAPGVPAARPSATAPGIPAVAGTTPMPPAAPGAPVSPVASNGSGFAGFGGNNPVAPADGPGPLDEGENSVPGPGDWSVKADPPEVPIPEIEAAKIKPIRLPGNSEPKDVLFPAGISSFVSVGRNADAGDVREVWNLATRQKVGSITGGKLNFFAVKALSPDGQHFAASMGNEGNKGVVVWSVKTGKTLGELETGETGFGLKYLAFAGNHRLVGLTSNKLARSWKIPDGEQEFDLNVGEADEPKEFAVSPGGNYLVSKSDKTVLRFIDLNTGETAGEVSLNYGERFFGANCYGFAFNREGTELAAVMGDGREKTYLFIINMADGAIVRRKTVKVAFGDHSVNQENGGPKLAFFADGSKLLWCGHHVLDARLGGPVWSAPEERNSSEAPRQILDAQHIVVVVGDRNGAELRTAPIPMDDIEKATAAYSAGGEATEAGMPGITKATVLGAQVLAGNATAAWSMQPDPAQAPGGAFQKAITISPDRGHLGPPFISRPDVGRAVVWSCDELIHNGMIKPGHNGQGRSQTVIDVFDLASGKSLSTFQLGYFGHVKAMSPDGTCIAVVPQSNNKDTRIDLYSLADGKQLVGWRPYGQAQVFKGVTEAVVVDSEHVGTSNFGGSFIMWKLPECKALYQMENAHPGSLSPNGRYLTLKTNGKCLFVEARTGTIVGECLIPAGNIAAGFSVDGSRLAVTGTDEVGSQLVILDTANGQILLDSYVPCPGDPVVWCTNRHILLGNSGLYDVEQDALAWSYALNGGQSNNRGLPTQGLGAVASSQPTVWYLAKQAFNDPSAVLTGVNLPEPQVADKIAKAKLEDAAVLKPGSKVSLQINIATNPPSKPNLATEVATAFAKRLSEIGMETANGAPYTIVVSAQQSPTGKTLEFRTFGRGLGTESASENKVDFIVEVIGNGQSIWKYTRSFTNGSHFIRQNDNKTLQQTLDEGMWNGAAGAMTSFPFPKKVFPPKLGRGLGLSNLVPGGTQPGVLQ